MTWSSEPYIRGLLIVTMILGMIVMTGVLTLVLDIDRRMGVLEIRVSDVLTHSDRRDNVIEGKLSHIENQLTEASQVGGHK